MFDARISMTVENDGELAMVCWHLGNEDSKRETEEMEKI